jgi:hypothetical protein
MVEVIETHPLSRSKEYQDLVDNTAQLEFQNYNPQIIANVFTKDQIDRIYKVVLNTPLSDLKVGPWGGQCAWLKTHFDSDITERINEIGFHLFGDEIELQMDYSFARYSSEFGYKPKLFPHSDLRPKPRFLLDIQLKTDESWGLVVEETTYHLEDNQALFFSGTNQVHWREDKTLSPHTRIDMLFCNFEFKDNRLFHESHKDVTENRAMFLKNKYKIEDTPVLADRKINELL